MQAKKSDIPAISDTHAQELQQYGKGAPNTGSQLEKELRPLLAELVDSLKTAMKTSDATLEKMILGGCTGLNGLNFTQIAKEADIWLDGNWKDRYPTFFGLLQAKADNTKNLAADTASIASAPAPLEMSLSTALDDLTNKLEVSGPLTVVLESFAKQNDFSTKAFATFTLNADLVHKIKLKSELSLENGFNFISSDAPIVFGDRDNNEVEIHDFIHTDSANLVVGQNAIWYEWSVHGNETSDYETVTTDIKQLIVAANVALQSSEQNVLLVGNNKHQSALEFLENQKPFIATNVVRDRQ